MEKDEDKVPEVTDETANDWQMDIDEFNNNGCMVNSD